MTSTRKTRPRRPPSTGISLVEVVIASLLVGFLLVAAMRALPGVLQTRTIAAQRCDASCLAQQLLSEIMQHAYEDPEEPGGPLGIDSFEAAGSRTDWDDVDDANGHSESPPVETTGSDMTQYTDWTRESSVEYLDPDDPQTTVLTDLGLKRIMVRVTSPTGETTQRWALRSLSGVLEQAPTPGDTTVVSWVGCHLQVGAGNDAVTGGTHVMNHAEDE